MDLSSGIFVALAVGWACYLIPKALRHHDEVAKTRSIETFSPATRVVARRETVARPVVEAPAPDPRVAKLASARAARRRRRILGLLATADLTIVVLVITDVLERVWVTAPFALTAMFLGLCRVLVKRERHSQWVAPTRSAPAAVAEPVIEDFGDDTALLDLSDLQASPEPAASFWDPLPMALPTYVGKATANRSVRTIDLSAPGVTSSGHNAADSRLVAEASARDIEDEGGQQAAAASA